MSNLSRVDGASGGAVRTGSLSSDFGTVNAPNTEAALAPQLRRRSSVKTVRRSMMNKVGVLALAAGLAVANACPEAAVLTERAGKFGLSHYDASSKCSWRLNAERPTAISVDSIDTEVLFDEVTVRADGQVVGRFSGTHASAPIVVSGDVEVVFESDSDVQGSGFSMSYAPAEDAPVSCGAGSPLSFTASAVSTPIEIPAGETCEVTIAPQVRLISGDVFVAGAKSVEVNGAAPVALAGCGKFSVDVARELKLRLVGSGDQVVLGAVFGEDASTLAIEKQFSCREMTYSRRLQGTFRHLQQNNGTNATTAAPATTAAGATTAPGATTAAPGATTVASNATTVPATTVPVINPGGVSASTISTIRSQLQGAQGTQVTVSSVAIGGANSQWTCAQITALYDGIALALFNFTDVNVIATAASNVSPEGALLSRGIKPFSCAKLRRQLFQAGNGTATFTSFSFKATTALGAQLLTRTQQIANGTISLATELAKNPAVTSQISTISQIATNTTGVSSTSIVGATPAPATQAPVTAGPTGTSGPVATTLAPTLPPKITNVDQAQTAVTAELERLRQRIADGGTASRVTASTRATYTSRLSCADRNALNFAMGQVLFNLGSADIVRLYITNGLLTLTTDGDCARRRSLSEIDSEMSRRLQQNFVYTTEGTFIASDPATAAAIQANVNQLGAGGGTALIAALQNLGTLIPVPASAEGSATVQVVSAAELQSAVGGASTAVLSAAIAAMVACAALLF
ncbi:unnamed protein product [Pedinophyceae sp. YPF-701]|nr:unnamed protein product [Pedinophyceae sp. YPF-701]